MDETNVFPLKFSSIKTVSTVFMYYFDIPNNNYLTDKLLGSSNVDAGGFYRGSEQPSPTSATFSQGSRSVASVVVLYGVG